MSRTINEIIVHCTASDPRWADEGSYLAECYDTSAKFKDAMDAIDVQDGKGSIAYHAVIHTDGTVTNGRALTEAADTANTYAGHGGGANQTNCIAICLMGGKDGTDASAITDKFTSDQSTALRNLIDSYKSTYSDITTVSGYKAGFDVAAWDSA